MIYFATEVQDSERVSRTAGVKARDDLEVVFREKGMEPLEIPSHQQEREEAGKVSKFLWHLKARKNWSRRTKALSDGDELFLQFPPVERTFLMGGVVRAMRRRGARLTLFIHDMEILRRGRRKDVSLISRLPLWLLEVNVLKQADRVVAHNPSMKEYLVQMGIPADRICSLGIFDYLIPGFEEHVSEGKDVRGPVIIAGNLRPHKAAYAYCLPEDTAFDLYGVGYEGEDRPNVRYHGSFPPDELPLAMAGSFGLVWDGSSVETCSGVYGEYLKINNPHKTSLYLASGFPVIVWKEAALADFVRENGVGIAVESLTELSSVLSALTEEEYAGMLRRTAELSKKLRSGYFAGKAIDWALGGMASAKN